MSEAVEKLTLVKTQAVFAPLVSEFKVAEHDRLNRDLVRDIMAWSEEEDGIVRSNVAGWHSDANIFKRPQPSFVEACKHFVEACKPTIARYLAKDGLKEKQFECEGWVNVNPPNAYNQVHTHDRYDLSGVYYVKVPKQSSKESGALQFLNPSYRGGPYSDLFTAMNPSKFTLNPSEGTLVIFPSAMPHWVLPNRENEDRISIAFNLRLK